MVFQNQNRLVGAIQTRQISKMNLEEHFKSTTMLSEVSNDVTPIWEKIRNNLKEKMMPQFYNAFGSDIRPLDWNGKELIIGSNDGRVIQFIEQNYAPVIQNTLQNLTVADASVKFIEIEKQITEQEEDTEESFSVSKQNQSKGSSQKNNNKTMQEDISAYDQVKSGTYPNTIKLNPDYSFNRFIKGPSNEHALAAAVGVAANPTTYHNPLYLYGGVGLGKTHLMMAIGNEVQMKFPWMNVLYTTAETFQNDLVEAVANKTLASLRTRYRKADILLLDDIQFISQRAEFTQEEIHHMFNYLYQNKKHIVISGDRAPQELSTLTDRLVSRFSSGLFVDIKPPNLETRMAILSSKATESNMEVPSDVLRFLAGRFNTQIRMLESALTKLRFVSEIEKRPIDLQMAKIALRDLPAENMSSQISIDEVIRVVSKTFHVDENEIKSNSRVEQVAMARHVCMYLTRKLIPSMSLSNIATAFGRNDHSTVIHADKKIKEKLDEDEALAVQIQELIDELSL